MSKEYNAEDALTGGGAYTEDELAGLSAEEREAITSTYEGEGEENLDLDDDEDVGAGDGEAEEAAAAAAATAAAEAEAAAAKVAAEAAAVEEAKELPQPAKEVPVRLPESVAEQFKTKLSDLATKFYDGEIELGEMLDQRDAINREIYNAEVELTEQARAADAWKSAQDAFFKANDTYLKDSQRYDDLNVFVKTVAARESNASFADVLAKAARMEAAMNGAPVPAAAKVPAAADPAAGGKIRKPQSPRPEAPNLADIPATSTNDTAGGEFAHMDSLSGIAYENALARMTEDVRERYLKS